MLNAENAAKLSELDAPLLTAYINTQPSEFNRHRLTPQTSGWVRRVGNALVEEVSPNARSVVREQLARIDRFLAESKPREKAILILAGPTVWKTISLPRPVENELSWGKPSLTQLRIALSRGESDCVVVLDRKGARFFDYNDYEMKETFDISFVVDSAQWKRKGSYVTAERNETTRGSQRDAYEQRINAQYNRFFRQVAEKCAALCGARKENMLILVGEPRLAKGVEKELPPSLVGGTRRIQRDVRRFSLPKLHKLLKEDIDPLRQEFEADLVDKVFRDGQHATLGIDETVAQLQKGRIRTLLLSEGFSGMIRECRECGQFDRSADPICSVCHRERRSVDLRQAVMDLARTNNTNVHVITGSAGSKLDEADGVAGWLQGRTQRELR